MSPHDAGGRSSSSNAKHIAAAPGSRGSKDKGRKGESQNGGLDSSPPTEEPSQDLYIESMHGC